MGRPLGVPNDPAFQRRVLLAALNLLEASAGPVLADYAEDAPQVAEEETAGFACPVSFAKPAIEAGLAGAVQQEVAALAPWYELTKRDRGRSVATLSGLNAGGAAKFLTDFIADPRTPVYRDGIGLELALRLAVQDIRAYYLESVAAQPGARAAIEARNWFYRETAAGQMLFKLREVCLENQNDTVRTYGGKGLIPLAIGPRPSEWT